MKGLGEEEERKRETKQIGMGWDRERSEATRRRCARDYKLVTRVETKCAESKHLEHLEHLEHFERKFFSFLPLYFLEKDARATS